MRHSLIFVLFLFFADKQIVDYLGYNVEYLWYNLIGCLLVMLLSLLIQMFLPKNEWVALEGD